MKIINIENVSKIFKVPKQNKKQTWFQKFKGIFYREWIDKTALKNINFSIEKGDFIGYLGPNGAGKSTTIKILTGVLNPTSGKVEILGFNPHKQRYQYTYNIGVVFGQRRLLQYDIPVIESFLLYKDIYEIDDNLFKQRLKYFTKILKLDRYLHIPVRKLSLGERMRCEIAASLLHKPKIVFLDEPTIGLDALAKEEIRNFLKDINKTENTTIILTTHDMDDIEALCKRIIIIDDGKVVYDNSIKKLKKEILHHKTIEIEYLHITDKKAFLMLLENKGIEMQKDAKNIMRIIVDINLNTIPDIIKKLFKIIEIADIKVYEPKLETIIKKIYNSKS